MKADRYKTGNTALCLYTDINCVVSFSLNLEKKWSLFKPEMHHNTSYIMLCYKITNVAFLQFMGIFKNHEITVFCCTCC